MKYLNRLRLNQVLRTSKKPRSPEPPTAEVKPVISCPYCSGTDLVKKGKRKKKYETVQLYFCRRCQRKFTPLINKRRKFPLKVIIDSITLYNRFNSMEKAAQIASGTYGIPVKSQNIANWLRDFKEHFPIVRLRSKIQNEYDTRRIFIESRLFHGQIYDFKCHYAKLDLLINNHAGHIDIVQIRNGKIHILDYKPRAKKEKPIDQLTIYALALSRLTGLKLYHFKCAWFDDSDYFEFYPLEVVYKKIK